MAAHAVYLGFDFGLKRIGVAVGQSLTGTAAPAATLAAQEGEPDWNTVAKLLADWQPAALVVGLPYNSDGSMQAIATRATRFARQLEGRYGLPVHQVDERFSSTAAEETLRASRAAGRRRVRKTDIDAAAACVILEAWLRDHPEAEHE